MEADRIKQENEKNMPEIDKSSVMLSADSYTGFLPCDK